MSSIESLEIVDAQIHEPKPQAPVPPELEAHDVLLQVELAREAMDSVGVDIAVSVTSEAFIACAADRYPERFPGVVTFWPLVGDLAAAAHRVRGLPAVVAGRALVGNAATAELRPEFAQGVFDPLFAAAEEAGLPMFVSTHGNCRVMAEVAERHPDLVLIIDHIGVAQHPVSPAHTQSWNAFPDLLELARYPNLHVKLCGAPLLSEEQFPFDDLWTRLNLLFATFGFDRVMWASDYTRMRLADLPKGERPRRRGLSYADSKDWLLRSDRIGFDDKRALFGGTARRVLRF